MSILNFDVQLYSLSGGSWEDSSSLVMGDSMCSSLPESLGTADQPTAAIHSSSGGVKPLPEYPTAGDWSAVLKASWQAAACVHLNAPTSITNHPIPGSSISLTQNSLCLMLMAIVVP